MKQADICVTLIDACGTDITVVNAARVSFSKQSEELCNKVIDPALSEELGEEMYELVFSLKEEDKKLIHYLAKHKHTSPFNHAFISFRVKAPLFVARQLVKHKFLPWNEVSRRYVTSEPEYYFPNEWRKGAENVKQGSGGPLTDQGSAYEIANMVTEYAQVGYETMLRNGVCPEQARALLPQNMMTEWYWSGTLGAWLDMLRLRLDSHTQKETRYVAALIHAELVELFPVSCAASLNRGD